MLVRVSLEGIKCLDQGGECSIVQYSAVQCSAVRYSTVQYGTEECSTVQYSAEQCSAVQYSAKINCDRSRVQDKRRKRGREKEHRTGHDI